MPFGEDDVEITYRASVMGMEDVKALAAQNQELNAQTAAGTQKTQEAVNAHQKNISALQRAGQEVRSLRRELYAITFTTVAMTAALTAMSKGSESAAIALDNLQRGSASFFGSIGNQIAKAGAFYGALFGGASPTQAAQIAQQQVNNAKSISTQIQLLTLEAKTAKEHGDDMLALQKKQEAEQLQLKKDALGDRYRILKKALDDEQAAEMEHFRLTELGLKSHLQIMKDVQKGLVSGFQGDVGNIFSNVISGRPQTGKDIIQSFRDTLGNVFGNAISQSLFTTMFQGGGIGDFFSNFKNILTGRTPAVVAAEKTADTAKAIFDQNNEMLGVLKQIAECTCSSARSAGASYVATITPPKTSALEKAGSILGAIGSLSSLGNRPGGGAPPVPGAPPGMSQTDMQNFLQLPGGKPNASGGFIQSFYSGGEVPAMVMPGEFVVRRPAAQANKNLLAQINAGGKPQAGTGGSVYVINANDAASFAQMLSSPSARQQMEIQIIRAISNNGSLRDIIRNYGK